MSMHGPGAAQPVGDVALSCREEVPALPGVLADCSVGSRLVVVGNGASDAAAQVAYAVGAGARR